MPDIILEGAFGWEITPKNVREQLKAAKGEDITVYLSSPGGFVDEGLNIYSQFMEYKRQSPKAVLTLNIFGFVASMGAYLAMSPAFDEVFAEETSVFMVHNVWGVSIGDYKQLEKDAKIFKSLSKPIVDLVSVKMGLNFEEAQKIVDDESYFFGEEIVANGFADKLLSIPGKEQPENKKEAFDPVNFLDEFWRKKKIETTKNQFEKMVAKFKGSDIAQEGGKNMGTEQGKEDQPSDELGRVKKLMALKGTYKNSSSEIRQKVSDIVDAAIINGDSEISATHSILAYITGDEAQAHQDSPGDLGGDTQSKGQENGEGLNKELGEVQF